MGNKISYKKNYPEYVNISKQSSTIIMYISTQEVNIPEGLPPGTRLRWCLGALYGSKRAKNSSV